MKVCRGVLTVVFGVGMVVSAQAEELKKINLDDVNQLGLKLASDAAVKTEGAGSIKIVTQWPTTVCLAEISDVQADNCTLVYKAKVKTDLSAKGSALLEMWCQVGGGQYFSRGFNSVVSAKGDWKEIQAVFKLEPGQKMEKLTLNLIVNGTGTVWVDDIVVSQEKLQQ